MTCSPQTVGIASGNWCPSGGGGAEDLDIEVALDQRLDDARSLIFDSEALHGPFEILGAPELQLTATVDRPVAYLAVRLNEVMIDGSSRRITYGILNLCHRDSSEAPSALEPGREYSFRLAMDHCAHRFRAGSRIRVSISTAYWPLILSPPNPVTLTIRTGLSTISLPERPPRLEDERLHAFAPPYVPPVATTLISSIPGRRVVNYDVRSGEQTIHHRVATGEFRLDDIGTNLVTSLEMRCVIKDHDPSGAVMENTSTFGWKRGDMKPRVVASATVTAHPEEIRVQATLHAFDGEQQVFERTWDHKIERDKV